VVADAGRRAVLQRQLGHADRPHPQVHRQRVSPQQRATCGFRSGFTTLVAGIANWQVGTVSASLLTLPGPDGWMVGNCHVTICGAVWPRRGVGRKCEPNRMLNGIASAIIFTIENNENR
ncbi:hypothetical protein, partial [Mycolicibacterium fallax]|uniref:hypothetical protein n=1 Tax=Mycolicibacterium fallax TaxID=1793 RepID=UPI0021F27E6B